MFVHYRIRIQMYTKISNRWHNIILYLIFQSHPASSIIYNILFRTVVLNNIIDLFYIKKHIIGGYKYIEYNIL